MPCLTGNNTVGGTEQHDSGALVLRSGLLESTCRPAMTSLPIGGGREAFWKMRGLIVTGTGAAAPPPAGAAAGWSCPGTLLPFPRFVCL